MAWDSNPTHTRRRHDKAIHGSGEGQQGLRRPRGGHNGFQFSFRIQINGRLLRGCFNLLQDVHHQVYLRPKAGASDLVQQTLLEAQRDFPQFRGGSAEELQAWLRCILRNNLANLIRHYRQTDKRQVAREVSLDASSQDLLDQCLVSDTTSPSGKAIKKEDTDALEHTLTELPEHYQQVLRWRHQEGRSFEEMGRLLGRSTDAARMLWWRAVEHLQQKLVPPSDRKATPEP